MYTSLLFNIYVATSITSQGRSLISSATMLFEMFLANNVKFGSLNQVVEFVNNVVREAPEWKYNSFDILDNRDITKEDVFAKLVLNCGYRWIPNDDDLEKIWTIVNNLSQEELVRVWYKNNLYEFLENTKVFELVRSMLHKLDRPFMDPLDPPVQIQEELVEFTNLLKEFVYYKYMIPDRIDRTINMIKSTIAVTDTDSCILSLDAWYRFTSEKISGEEFSIMNYLGNPISFFEYTEEDEAAGKPKPWMYPISFVPKKYDYNFQTDEIVEMKHYEEPTKTLGEDNMRYSIINIMAYVLGILINDYMEEFCKNTHSYNPEDGRPCKIYMKTEFLMKRMMMTTVKKNYASWIAVQEGNVVPEDKRLAITGIECLTKSTKSDKTKAALKKILTEDIMKVDTPDQLKIIKDFAIFEKEIVNSLKAGSKEYYKPVTIKSMSAYDDPLKIQGIKASVAWNEIRPKELPAIDLETRNPIDIAKVKINKATIEVVKDKYPEIYENLNKALDNEIFIKRNKKNGKIISQEIDSIAIPLDVNVPPWLLDLIDYTKLVFDNTAGFPFGSVGIASKKGMSYTNILSL